MNLPQDLRLTGQQPNVALTIFFVPYVIFEIPSNLLMKRFKPHVWSRFHLIKISTYYTQTADARIKQCLDVSWPSVLLRYVKGSVRQTENYPNPPPEYKRLTRSFYNSPEL